MEMCSVITRQDVVLSSVAGAECSFVVHVPLTHQMMHLYSPQYERLPTTYTYMYCILSFLP